MLSRREFLTGFCACALGAAGGVAGGYKWGRADEASRYVPGRPTLTEAQRHAAQPDAVFNVKTDERVIALTFDDGPDPHYTPTVLDLLAAHKASATFFVVGANVRAHGDLVHRQHDAGHALGNHTYDHPQLELLAPAEVDTEIDRGAAALRGAGLGTPTLFRPPKGFTDDVVGVLADALRYRTIFWDLCVERFLDGNEPKKAVDQLMRRAKPGSIILAHDGGHILAPGKPFLDRRPTMRALPILMDRLEREGFRFVDIPRLLTLGPLPRLR